MNYEKIITLPQNPQKAISIFEDLIHNQVYVLFVVLWDDDISDKLLDLGSKAAGGLSDPGMVVWITNPETIQSVIDQLNDKTGSINNLNSVRAFMLSISDNIVDVIMEDERRIDMLRVWKSIQLALND